MTIPPRMPPVERLPATTPDLLRLRLADPALFFLAPAVDPLANSHLGLSGFETIFQQLKQRRLVNAPTTRIDLEIPAETLAGDIEQRLRPALADHVAALIGVERAAQLLLAKERTRAWLVGGSFLVICLILATAIDHITLQSGFIGRLISETIIIAGWVGLWRPLELTFYDWWPSSFRVQILEQLAATELTITPIITPIPAQPL